MGKEINIIDILFAIIIVYASYYVSKYLIVPLLFPEDNGCGCNRRPLPTDVPPAYPTNRVVVHELELLPIQKACVAVGICDEEEVGYYNREEAHKWRKHIIENADRIFSVVKTGKEKVEKGGKGKKSTKKNV